VVVKAKSYVGELHKGDVALDQGDAKSAIEHLRRYTAAQPNHAYGHTALGYALQRNRQYSEAAREYERSLQLDAGNRYVQVNLGKVYFQLGRPDDAAQMLSAGIARGGADADDYYWYAEALKATGQFQQAEQAARQALRLDSKNGETQELLAAILKAE